MGCTVKSIHVKEKNTSGISKCQHSDLKDIRMNHDLVEVLKEKLDNLSISDYHGLRSPGLTCYLNSVLQVLFMTEGFREAVTQCCSKDSTTINPHLGSLFSELQKRVAETHNLTEKLGITNVYEQRDAAEYFEKILCLTSPEAAEMFKGELNHWTMCHNCEKRNNSSGFFWILHLAVDDLHHQIYSVEKGLEAFFNGEKVCGDNKMYCNRCKGKQDADFGCEITQNPEVLTLLLKRFSLDYTRMRYVKLHCKVDVPQTLHTGNCKYDLYAVVNHFGNLTGGHYTAHIKSFETQVWYHFNDNIVERVKKTLFGAEDKSLRSRTAYLLMYRKVITSKLSRDPERTDEDDQQAVFANSGVETEGRHNEAERGEALVPHHQLQDEGCDRRKYLKCFNGDVLKRGHDDSVLKEELNQRTTCLRRNKEMLPHTDTAADGDRYKHSLQTQKSKSAKLQKDGGQKSHEPDRQQLDTNSETHMGCPNTRGSSTVKSRPEYKRSILEQNHESQKKTLKTTEAVWVTQNNIVANPRKETSVTGSLKRNRDKLSYMSESDVKSSRVSSSGCSSSSVPQPTPRLRSQFPVNEPTGFNSSTKLCRESNSPKRDEEKVQQFAAAHSCWKLCNTQAVTKEEKPTSSPKKINPKSTNKVKKEPWKW